MSVQTKTDGWIEWSGGECPVEEGTLIDVRDADGFIWERVEALDDTNTADMWAHRGGTWINHIAAYRRVEPEHAEVDLRDIADQPEAALPPPAYVPLPAGLTNREWIAGQVLAGIAGPLLQAAGEAKEDPNVVAATIARVSVGLTDALIAELAKVSP